MSNNQVASIISKSVRKKKTYNVLTFNTHERYQTQLAKTGHNFYAFNADGMKEWITGHGEIPENYYNLPKNSIYTGLDLKCDSDSKNPPWTYNHLVFCPCPYCNLVDSSPLGSRLLVAKFASCVYCPRCIFRWS